MRAGIIRIAPFAMLAMAASQAAAQVADRPGATDVPQAKPSIERLIDSLEHFDPNLAGAAAQKNMFDLLNRPDRCPLHKRGEFKQACAILVFTPFDPDEAGAPRYYYMPAMELRSNRRVHVLFNGRYQDLTFEQLATAIQVNVGASRRVDYIPLAVLGNEEDMDRRKACKEGERCNALAPCSHDQLFDHSGSRVNSCFK